MIKLNFQVNSHDSGTHFNLVIKKVTAAGLCLNMVIITLIILFLKNKNITNHKVIINAHVSPQINLYGNFINII